jgi:microcystin-dependent protein
MGFFDDYLRKNGIDHINKVINVEWVLRKLDEAWAIIFTRNRHGLVPAPDSSTSTRYLREDGVWVIPPPTPTDVLGVMKAIYRVGSLYFTTENSNPGNWMTGTTWAVWGSGRVPVGFDAGNSNFNTIEKTGGSTTHNLSTSEMPSHSHTQQGSFTAGSNGAHTHSYVKPLRREGDATASEMGGEVATENNTTGSSGSHTHSVTISGSTTSSGGGNAHNNLQPYITCYIWKRTG